MTFIKQLEKMGACSEGVDWLKETGYKTDAEAWKNCPRADWMIWYSGRKRANRKALVTMACVCARTALKHVPKGENRPRIAIETTEKWLRGEASLRDVKIAAAHVVAAANADAARAAAIVGNAAAHAADAEYVAAIVGDAAAHAADAEYVAAAGRAAAAAEYVVAAAAACVAARTKALKVMAKKIREIYPSPPKKERR